MTARSALPLALACLLTALAAPTQAGSPDAPEVVDAPDDAGLPPLDLAAVWFEASDTEVLVHIERGTDSTTPPAIVACQDGQCVGAGVALRVVFRVLQPDGTPAPAFEGYNASYVLVRLGPDDAALSSAVGYLDDGGTFNPVAAGNLTVDGAQVVVAVPRAATPLAIPAGAAPGAYRLSAPYALSYLMPCFPNTGQGVQTDGCRNVAAPDPAVASAWDRAPDTGAGLDYVFPSPPPAPAPAAKPAPAAAASTTTVTQVQVKTEVVTVTVTESFTSTPYPLHVESKGAPAAGLAFAALAVGAALLARRRLA